MSSLKHYVLQNRSSGQGVEVQRIMRCEDREKGWHIKQRDTTREWYMTRINERTGERGWRRVGSEMRSRICRVYKKMGHGKEEWEDVERKKKKE